jgi:quinol monooxygenase YgiN
MYQDHLQWIVEFSINRGRNEEFEKLAREMSDMVRRFEPGTRKYEWFLDRKRNKCVVVESYDGSVSALAHIKGEAIKKLFPRILKIAKVSRFEVCGDPSEELIKELSDVDAKLYSFISGFSR